MHSHSLRAELRRLNFVRSDDKDSQQIVRMRLMEKCFLKLRVENKIFVLTTYTVYTRWKEEYYNLNGKVIEHIFTYIESIDKKIPL